MNHCNCPLKEKEDQFQIVNNWTKTIGNHAVKFGADIRYARNLRVPSDSDRTGVNNFGNGPTSGLDAMGNPTGGLGWATYILGDVTAFNRYASTSTNAKEFQPRDFFYVQDTWRTTPKLTLNLGIRYEYYAPERVNGTGNGSLTNLTTGYINVAGEGGIPLDMGVSAAKNTYNPRIGVAYQYNEKTVIRAGYGRSFDLGVFGSISATWSRRISPCSQISRSTIPRATPVMRSISPTPQTWQYPSLWEPLLGLLQTHPRHLRTTRRQRLTRRVRFRSTKHCLALLAPLASLIRILRRSVPRLV